MMERMFEGALKFNISLDSFFQSNTIGAEMLHSCVSQFVMNEGSKKYTNGATNGLVLLDVCCGAGTIGIALHHLIESVYKKCGVKIRKIYGLEMMEAAIIDARRNAELNGFSPDVCE